MNYDLKLIEEGNGGELVKNTGDLATISGFQNMIYLGLFGGNVRASTPVQRVETEEAFDWWANNLLSPGDASIQFNSETERALNNTALTSSGRGQIQTAVENDLAFMQDFATIIVNVSIVGVDKIAIGIRALQPDNIQKQDFIFIWNATKKELMDEESFTVKFSPVSNKIFDFSFDVTFE